MSGWASARLSLCLVVPLFNEEERVGESMGPLMDFIEAAPAGSQLLLSDDGSTDRTLEVVSNQILDRACVRAVVLALPHAGKGSAVRSGLQMAKSDLAAFCDVDLATPLEEIDRLVDVAASGNVLAIGSRAAAGAVLSRRESRRRELAGKAFNRVVKTTLCGEIADTQCGAKAASTYVWRSILAYSGEVGFSWDVEAIALARRLGFAVEELGVKWTHDDRTRVRVTRDGLAMVWSLPRIALRLRSVVPQPAVLDLAALERMAAGFERVVGTGPAESTVVDLLALESQEDDAATLALETP
jgi:dolichyl-phosphate beta-glucosyltransferase